MTASAAHCRTLHRGKTFTGGKHEVFYYSKTLEWWQNNSNVTKDGGSPKTPGSQTTEMTSQTVQHLHSGCRRLLLEGRCNHHYHTAEANIQTVMNWVEIYIRLGGRFLFGPFRTTQNSSCLYQLKQWGAFQWADLNRSEENGSGKRGQKKIDDFLLCCWSDVFKTPQFTVVQLDYTGPGAWWENLWMKNYLEIWLFRRNSLQYPCGVKLSRTANGRI